MEFIDVSGERNSSAVMV